ncbi:DUF1616 domain-containing protein [Methanosarcina sp. MSH10X1]|uniref:DUF1616 domain-containing protein n=1 Tax=Methanosarcina sp. MSH10X1 TaxID=2507075 RepID=UPI000FFC29BE|nr:DUF1616 domain-containing protein [Methanosarcina sp. MSH10X1]RXA20916.1 DUF1616 domain-containing protein [Methanosarcina sp. MSH10X1]
MPYFKKCVYVDDLLAITFFSCLAAVFVLIEPFNETFFKIPLALSLFFFIPGYAFISALFPGKKEISGIERFTLSVGFSLILTVFDGFLISLLPSGYRPIPIVVSIVGITAFFSIIALFTRKLLDEDEQFSFSIREFIRSLKSDASEEGSEAADSGESENEEPLPAEQRRFHRSRSKVKAKGLRYKQPETGVKIKPLPPQIEKALIIALIGSIIISSGMLAYAKMTREKETFTMLYLLGPDGKAEGYPEESLLYVPINATVGIENHELRDVVYVLQMRLDGEVIKELNVPLTNGEAWQKNLTYTRQELKNGKSKLEFALFKQKPDYFPYRSVHLYIENNNSFNHLNDENYSIVPSLENGEMESSTGWNFTSNADEITGSYVSGLGVNSSSAYGMNNSYNGTLFDSPEQSGEISQRIKCDEETITVLSAYVKDDFNSSSSGAGAQVKYLTVNGEIVWTDGISEYEDWQHIEVPVSLHAGDNVLAFGLNQTSGELAPVQVLWDSISFKPLSELSVYVSNSNTVETTPPESSVEELPAFTNQDSFTVSWNGTDDNSGIAYYSIDSSTDGVNWEPWISRTTDTSSVFAGEHDQTYYFRSRAMDNAGNEEPAHPAPDTKTRVYTGTPVATLDISPNPCKGATNITVTYPVPLSSVVCRVTRDGFKPETGELTSTDGITWTGGYITRYGNYFIVEAICTDIYGNTVPVMGEIYVDNSLPDFEIEANPHSIDTGDLEIRVTPSTALKKEPSVSISANEQVNVTYLSYSDGDYYYTADIKSEIDEGDHKISVTGTDLNSEKVEGNITFVVDHPA